MSWQDKFSSPALNEQDAIPELMLTHLSSWGVIDVTGEDRKSYLQGQVTCDVVTLNDSESTLGAHCDAKGKVWSIFRLFQHKGGYALFQHASAIEKALTEIKKYSVFSKVNIEISSEVVIAVMGSQADSYIAQNTQDEGDVRAFGNGTAVKVEDTRWLILLPEQEADELTKRFSGDLVSESIWDLMDILSAQPRITKNQQNEHIPQALNLHLLGGISFSKGCYTGQETVARAKYRGTNKRTMYLLKGASETDLPDFIEVERSVGTNWRSVGEFITTYRFANGTVYGLIVMPNNLEQETNFRLTHHSESSFSFVPMPYSLDG